MDLGRFSAILDAYGAAPECWPAQERDAALALSRSSVSAVRALARAKTLDSALSHMAVPALASDTARFIALQSAIMSAAKPRAGSWFSRWLGVDLAPAQLWPSLAGLAMATVLGFGVGFGGLIQTDADQSGDEVSILSPIDLPAASP